MPDSEQAENLGKCLNINQHLSAMLIQRGIDSFSNAKKYFRPSLQDLHDPFLMKDMDLAVDRIHLAISKQEGILVFGDYDVDGTTAVALVYSYLRKFHKTVYYYIPDRYAEGYGISEKGIRWAIENNCKLIIALDLGIKSNDLVALAHDNGTDVIICDHHVPGESIPTAIAVLDPKRNDCHYPFQELSGCGIGYKLVQAYDTRYRGDADLSEYLDLVAVSIASDIVPITDENRILTYHGLLKLNLNPIPGLKALKEISGVRGDLDVNGIVFTLGPRINAAGRIDHANNSVNLLISTTDDEARGIAKSIDEFNISRREKDIETTEEAIAMINSNDLLKSAKTTVLFKDSWSKGVIGIVASRCIEKFYRPTIILTEFDNKVTGSARSIRDFDLYQALYECSDLLEKFGGHKYAAGLTMHKEKLEAFQLKFEMVAAKSLTDEMLIPALDIDVNLNFDMIGYKFLNILKQMGPFGPGNPLPTFATSQVRATGPVSVIKDKHLKLLLSQESNKNQFIGIGFDMIGCRNRIESGDSFSIAYQLEENNYQQQRSIQLRIKDIKFQ